jgi:hypothetical protein
MNMTGHRLFTLAALALLAGACNREVISPDEGREAIDFSASFAQDLTKAVGEKSSLANADKIGVFACHTGDIPYDLYSVSPDFMYNQEVTYNEENWTYSPVKYWPNNSPEYISFFSYYPYISSELALASTEEGGIIGFSNANAKGDPWLVYKLPKNAPSTQIDLMYGTPQINTTKQGVQQSQNQKVQFTLKHALACIADEVTVKMSDDLYTRMHNDLDISITGLKIEYSNLTTKARLVLNSGEAPNWKEVISGELLTSRTYTSEPIPISTNNTFSKEATTNPAAMTIDSGHGLFYIPLQIAGQPRPQAEITLSYTVTGVGDNGSFTDTVVKVLEFAPGNASKKQNLALTLTENFNLEADIVTEETNGISMPGDLPATDQEVRIDYDLAETTLDYTGDVQTFTAPRTGTYQLEAWGAQGGSGTNAGAKGGYAKAQFKLSIGDVLYIYVGGKGGDGGASTDTVQGSGGTGGWNGGGAGGKSYFSSDGWKGGGGGGGATHIAMSPIGNINTATYSLSSYVDVGNKEGHLLLVAGGGGGGSWKEDTAGAGGGDNGIAGKNGDGLSPVGWSNPNSYSIGINGGNGISGSGGAEGNGGGGGGYVGGNAKTNDNEGNHTATSGSGGSSKANDSRYNYVTGSFFTRSYGQEGYISPEPTSAGNGKVVITFKEAL